MARANEYESKQERINHKNYKNQERVEVDSLLNEITYIDQMRLKIPIVKFALKPRQILISIGIFFYFYFFNSYQGEKSFFLVFQSFLPYEVFFMIILYLFSNEKYEDVLT